MLNFFLGILPVRAFVVIVSEEEFLGHIKKHRLNFKVYKKLLLELIYCHLLLAF